MSKDERCNNGGERRSWFQRNIAIVILFLGWLFLLSGGALKTWAQSNATAILAEKTDVRGLLDHDSITTIKSDVAYVKEEVSDIKTELKAGRALLNDILRAVKK